MNCPIRVCGLLSLFWWRERNHCCDCSNESAKTQSTYRYVSLRFVSYSVVDCLTMASAVAADVG